MRDNKCWLGEGEGQREIVIDVRDREKERKGERARERERIMYDLWLFSSWKSSPSQLGLKAKYNNSS